MTENKKVGVAPTTPNIFGSCNTNMFFEYLKLAVGVTGGRVGS